MLRGSRKRLTKRQSSRDSFARWALDAALIGKMAKLEGGIICENGIDDCIDG